MTVWLGSCMSPALEARWSCSSTARACSRSLNRRRRKRLFESETYSTGGGGGGGGGDKGRGGDEGEER